MGDEASRPLPAEVEHRGCAPAFTIEPARAGRPLRREHAFTAADGAADRSATHVFNATVQEITAMSTTTLMWLPSVLLVLGCHSPGAFAQPAPGAAERLHANAVSSFRQARFSEAYGRLILLADAGHAPSAELALWMFLHGPTLFGKDWDSSPEQLTAWAQLAGQPVPTMVGRSYPPTLASVAQRVRSSAP